jgi:hypothetical protein
MLENRQNPPVALLKESDRAIMCAPARAVLAFRSSRRGLLEDPDVSGVAPAGPRSCGSGELIRCGP